MRKIFFLKGNFADLNPIALMIFFVCVIGISMFSLNPVILILSSAISLICLTYISGVSGLLRILKPVIFLAFLTMLINPLFNHRGRTVLAVFPGGSNLTLESVVYGAMAALIFISVFSWFSLFNHVFDSDKILYVFGNISPTLALLISMSLRFIPEMSKKSSEIRCALKGSINTREGKMLEKLRLSMLVMSGLISWSIENAVAKAKSMRDRAYGTKKRTYYTIYKWTLRDMVMSLSSAFCLGIYIFGAIKGVLKYWYFPVMYGELFSVQAIIVYAFVVLLAMFPILFDFSVVLRHRVMEGRR